MQRVLHSLLAEKNKAAFHREGRFLVSSNVGNPSLRCLTDLAASYPSTDPLEFPIRSCQNRRYGLRPQILRLLIPPEKADAYGTAHSLWRVRLAGPDRRPRVLATLPHSPQSRRPKHSFQC